MKFFLDQFIQVEHLQEYVDQEKEKTMAEETEIRPNDSLPEVNSLS